MLNRKFSKRTKPSLKSEQDLKASSSKVLTTEVRYSEEDEIQQPAQNEPEPNDSDGDYPDDFESDSNTKRSKTQNERISTTSRKSMLDNLKPFFQSMNSVSVKSILVVCPLLMSFRWKAIKCSK